MGNIKTRAFGDHKVVLVILHEFYSLQLPVQRDCFYILKIGWLMISDLLSSKDFFCKFLIFLPKYYYN